jgi:L-amino acid N-acyltransferase YncA
VAYLVRSAELGDLKTIVDIWMAGVEISLGTRPPAANDYHAYFKRRLNAQNDVFKVFVVENETGDVVAWQSLSPFRSNPAVSGVMAELSAYSSPDHTPGRPTLLGLEETFRFADASPLHYVVAFIAGNNPKALRLAEHLGMQKIGTFPVAPQAPHLPPLAYLVYPCAASVGASIAGGGEPQSG